MQEFLAVPVEYLGQVNGPAGGVHAHVARVVEKIPRLALQLGFEVFGAKRHPRQARATERHAVQGEMHALFAERTDDVVLVGVKRLRSAADRELAQKKEVQYLDAAERVRHAALQRVVHGKGVVGIEVVGEHVSAGGEAPRLVRRRHCVHPGDVAVEIGPLARERGVIHAPRFVDKTLQHPRPGLKRLGRGIPRRRRHELRAARERAEQRECGDEPQGTHAVRRARPRAFLRVSRSG